MSGYNLLKHDFTEVYRDLSLLSDCYYIYYLHAIVQAVTFDESFCGGVVAGTS
jgi:hypothetical protein